MKKGLDRRTREQMEEKGYKVRSLVTHRISGTGYLTRVVAHHKAISGFGQENIGVVYLLNRKSTNPFMAGETLTDHIASVQKQHRSRTRKPKPDITVYSNGNRVYDDEGNRLSRSGRYEASSGISDNPKAAEAKRQELVPNYHEACAFRAVLAKPYDFCLDEEPLFVECKHPEFRKENYGECLGQCALAGRQYGRNQSKFLYTNDGSLDYTTEYQQQLKQI